jgi:hypothetical protein
MTRLNENILVRDLSYQSLISILNQVQREKKKEMREFSEVISQFKDTLEYGEMVIKMRFDHFCKETLKKILDNSNLKNTNMITNLENVIVQKESDKRYNVKSYRIDEYYKCLFFVKPQIARLHGELKQKISNLKFKEKEIINKCFVTLFDEREIKQCLKQEMDISQADILNNIKIYTEELEKFSQNIYI